MDGLKFKTTKKKLLAYYEHHLAIIKKSKKGFEYNLEYCKKIVYKTVFVLLLMLCIMVNLFLIING